MSNEAVMTTSTISQAVKNTVDSYLQSMSGENITNLYDLVLEQVEEALFDFVMPHFKLNQVKAAETLGLSRGTLRKKLRHYFGDKYCGERGDKS